MNGITRAATGRLRDLLVLLTLALSTVAGASAAIGQAQANTSRAIDGLQGACEGATELTSIDPAGARPDLLLGGDGAMPGVGFGAIADMRLGGQAAQRWNLTSGVSHRSACGPPLGARAPPTF